MLLVLQYKVFLQLINKKKKKERIDTNFDPDEACAKIFSFFSKLDDNYEINLNKSLEVRSGLQFMSENTGDNSTSESSRIFVLPHNEPAWFMLFA